MFRRSAKGSFISLRLSSFIIVSSLLFWIGGFFWFAATLPEETSSHVAPVDAIVVLTGGSDRINTGLELLANGQAKKLFISGVYQGVEVRELLSLSQQAPNNLECCVTLGYEADDTRGNALETKSWLDEQGYKSLRLVTASYHMPRSLLEFRHAMPQATIQPYPVFPSNVRHKDWWMWPGSMTLILSEYNKFLLAQIRNWGEDLRDKLIG
ncbi:YdcF family protein [Kiloniella laminariae]|uniref:YdcF family protein n=1 Tax=Kiloniella laminariae TaxID=454162 RepID=A0ABT4LMQ9_9PROT|nr:YdcF family protein [Kiloniella laminariae]MCZ4281641.1 YdcF family protein [Kiloniella laminariae]